ncbi:Ser/Thr phosphatase family protein, partial [Ostertagia ostertagi]
DSLLSRIVLVGDGGQFTNGRHPVSDAIRASVPLDKKTVVLFLGDNVYKVGLPDDQVITYNLARSILDSQISIVANTKARLYMIPGNHDWNNGQPAGYETILREQYYVNLLGKDNVRFFPQDGCGGPVVVDVDDETILIILDSQWWIHPYDKPGIESDCPYKTKDEILTQLEDILAKNYKKLVILATHHPFRSNGVHGGYFGLKQHLFPFTEMNKNLYIPLPVLGSIYPIARSVFGTPQDLKHPEYANMVHDVEKVARKHPNLIFVAGHEHNLQLLKDSSYYYLVSGSGSKTQRVNKSRKSLYVAQENGFATLEISKNKNVRASFYTVSDSVRKPFSENIMNFSKLPELKEAAPEVKKNAEFKDTVNAAASEKYKDPSAVQRWVSQEDDNKIKVTVYERREQKDTAIRLYQRIFDHKTTKELRLFGLHGNDLFEVDNDAKSKIKIRIIGGKGNDTFDIKGSVAVQLYDMDTSANYILNKSHTRMFFSSHPSVNEFKWVENQYPITRFPRIGVGFNNDDGFFIGA